MLEPADLVTPAPNKAWAQFSTMVIALCALGSSLWQGYSLQQHNKLAVRPVLQIESNISRNVDGKIWFELLVNNNGLGPADVQHVEYQFGSQRFQHADALWAALLPNAPLQCRGAGNVQRFYKVDDQQMLVRALDAGCYLTEAQYQQLMQQLKIHIRYASLYGESFVLQWGEPSER